MTTIAYTYHPSIACPPDDFGPSVTAAVADAKLYCQALWCKGPCWPVPIMGITRTEWRCEGENAAEIVLYITFLCTPALPGDEDKPDDKM
jgi:hypothetical protein